MKLLIFKTLKWLLLPCMSSLLLASMMVDDGKLHSQIKMAVYKGQWDRAVTLSEKFVAEYPNSIYADDAQYWIGFSLEQKEMFEEAYEAYGKVTDRFPGSNWIDDAMVHQIGLAKKMVASGRDAYRPFLFGMIANRDSTIRYQAALALGELRDPAALPVLEEMAKHPDENIVRMSMEILGRYSRRLENDATLASVISRPGKESDETAVSYVFKALRRKTSMWTEEKLLLNGLYHIVPIEDMTFYLMLQHDWDRNEWWRKFWAPRDPTPTTEKNEAEEAFKERVQYAYEHFGRDWEKQGVNYPPWDARGELYIRFGDPDRRENREKDWEEWTYYRYKVNFKVSSRNHNADGKSIELAAVSRYLYRNNMGRSSLLLNTPSFYYADPCLESIENMRAVEFRLQSIRRYGNQFTLRFNYTLPASNFKLQDRGQALKGGYEGRWIVFDEDHRNAASGHFSREIHLANKREYARRTISGSIEVSLIPGSYTIALRIEDQGSSRLGIYKKNFKVKPRGPATYEESRIRRGKNIVVYNE